MSAKEVAERLREALTWITYHPVKCDSSGRLSEDGERDLNRVLMPHGLRVARLPDGSLPFIGLHDPPLRLEADGAECETCAHGRNTHTPYGCRVVGCECDLFKERT